jgi:hypothetical protein
MNPFSLETIFLILSGVILASGVLYWFWSHIQLTQKKVQLLENAVFELRGRGSASASASGEPQPSPVVVSGSTPEPAPYKDIDDDDDWKEEETEPDQKSTPLEQLVSDDLMPGGHVEQFRELFINKEQNTESPVRPVESSNQTLEGLPLKELRRMASERGIVHASEMRKKDVIAALRGSVPVPVPEPVVIDKEVEVVA